MIGALSEHNRHLSLFGAGPSGTATDPRRQAGNCSGQGTDTTEDAVTDVCAVEHIQWSSFISRRRVTLPETARDHAAVRSLEPNAQPLTKRHPESLTDHRHPSLNGTYAGDPVK